MTARGPVTTGAWRRALLRDALSGLVVSALLGPALACGSSGSQPTSTDGCAGESGCPCEQDEDCRDGLACVDDVCGAAAVTTTSDAGGGSPGTTTGTGHSPDTVGTFDVTGDGESDGLGCEFSCPEDAPPFVCAAPGGAASCDLFQQDCPFAEKCFAYDEDQDGVYDGGYCAPLEGDALLGAACSIDESGYSCFDTCARGLRCWHVDPERGEGSCAALCGGDAEAPECDAPGFTCLLMDGGALNVCVPICDPLLQDCDPLESCVGSPVDLEFLCVPNASDGETPTGAPCDALNACAPGLMCVDAEMFPAPDECGDGPGCCAPFCDLQNGNEDCQGLGVPNLACEPYFEEGMMPGVNDVGLCRPAG